LYDSLLASCDPVNYLLIVVPAVADLSSRHLNTPIFSKTSLPPRPISTSSPRDITLTSQHLLPQSSCPVISLQRENWNHLSHPYPQAGHLEVRNPLRPSRRQRSRRKSWRNQRRAQGIGYLRMLLLVKQSMRMYVLFPFSVGVG
jgi:hypothetical protein